MYHLIIDDAIPFLEGRLENDFTFRLMPGEKISRSDLAQADGLLVRTRTRCDAATLEGTPVSFVATGTIGLDHIDGEYCDAHGIEWQNAPGCNAPAVAQYVWRALFKLGFAEMRNPDGGSPILGVVGKGNVGSIVAQWGRALGFRVIVSDPPRALRFGNAETPDEDYLPLHQLIGRADAVTFHTPLIKAQKTVDGITMEPTLHLADAEELSHLRPGAIIINASRGGVIDETALLGIKNQKGLKICIDTWEGEPRVNPDLLAAADIATFHIAGYSRRGKERATRAIIEGLERHFHVNLDKSGLAARYEMPAALSRKAIEDSYDIMADDLAFRSAPEDFETLRNTYPLRNEVGE